MQVIQEESQHEDEQQQETARKDGSQQGKVKFAVSMQRVIWNIDYLLDFLLSVSVMK